MAVIVAKLVECSLPTPEIRTSNVVVGNFYFLFNCLTKELAEKNMKVVTTPKEKKNKNSK